MNGFMNLLFSPDEPTGGDTDPAENVNLPSDKMGADLAAANAAEETTEATAETPAAAPETPAPAAPAEDKTDYKAEYEKAKAEREEYAQKMAQEAYQQQMAQIASESAEMYERVYKVKPPPGMFKEEQKILPSANAPTPQDQLARDLAAVKKWQADQDAAIAEAKKQAAVNQERQVQSERIYSSLAKHKDVFDNPVRVNPADTKSPSLGDYLSELAVAKFVSALNANPKTANPDAIAAEVAAIWKASAEHIKKTYVTEKKTTAARIPVGAGAGGRQAGTPAGKKSWADLEKAMGDGLKTAERDDND